jgi:PadR family transcriptional regulator, regulatory protein AphA
MEQGLTTTSYAVLGLLTLRPWSAYELAQQMKRSLRNVWPRAESAIYREPAKLVEAGYATAREVPAGPTRTKVQYTATAKGRRAFRRWLAQPSEPPLLESEGLLRVLFADQGTRDDLERTLGQLADQATVFRDRIADYARADVKGEGPFPDRTHVINLFGRFMLQYAQTTIDWAKWAQSEISQWPDTEAEASRRGPILAAESLVQFGLPMDSATSGERLNDSPPSQPLRG